MDTAASQPSSSPVENVGQEKESSVSEDSLPGAEFVGISADTLSVAQEPVVIELKLPSEVDPEIQSAGELLPIAQEFIRVERLTWWILTGVVGGILLVGWLLSGWLIRGVFDAYQWLGLLIPLVPIAGGIAAGRYFPRKTYDSTHWRLNQHGLEIRHGIWWRHRIFIPTERIQHTDVQQGPIMRMYDLATLVINTGGTHEPSVPLGGLKLATAEELRDKLAVQVKSSGAER